MALATASRLASTITVRELYMLTGENFVTADRKLRQSKIRRGRREAGAAGIQRAPAGRRDMGVSVMAPSTKCAVEQLVVLVYTSLSFALARGPVRPQAACSLRHPIADRTPSL